MDVIKDINLTQGMPKRKRTVRIGALFAVTLAMMIADMLIVAFHPAYRDYKRMDKKVAERILAFENGFKKDYINAVLEVASEIRTSRTNSVPSGSSNSFSSSVLRNVGGDSPFSKPVDITRGDYRYFVVGGLTGFSLGGTLVFRVGDLFLGRRIVSADRFGAVLEDGGIIRNGEIARSETKTKGCIDDKRTN